MGFYFELNRVSDQEFSESAPLGAYWFLYAVGGFALLCMGLSAWSLIWQMIHSREIWDQMLIAGVLSFIPLYVIVGLKLFAIRKYIRWDKGRLEWGYRLLKWPIFSRRVSEKDILGIEMVHQNRTGNLAPHIHENKEYYINGHWRIVLRSAKKNWVVDKHTDREALIPLFEWLKR